MKNILVAIDFSDISDALIAKACEIAGSFSCQLWMIHVAAPDPEFVGYAVGPQHVRDWRASTLRREHQILQKKAEDIEKTGIDVTPLLVQGPTIESILSEAAKLEADLIVVGSHGHSAFFETVVGTVSHGLLRRSPYPLLIIPVGKRPAPDNPS